MSDGGDQYKSDLQEFAKVLIARHLRVSMPGKPIRDWLAARKPDGYERDLVESKVRCVVVVGAGASDPLMARSDELAKRLEAKFGRDEAELERLELVNNLDRKALETRLIALSKTPDAAREVRATIASEYRIRHPTVLAYELIAHLLKHRFVDAIVSFNFDELLDRSLDDELASNEYRRIISDRDCDDIECDPDADGYIPLYVKLHGTASEPESLRFTPDSYYNLPATLADIVKKLLRVDRCVIMNVGFGLASFDFQRLLGIPRDLDVYDFSHTALDPTVVDKITSERQRAGEDSDVADEDTAWLHSCADGSRTCDEHLEHLCDVLAAATKEITGKVVGQIVEFRSVGRHAAVAELLKAASPAGSRPDAGEAAQDEIDYLNKRATLELAFAGAKARGLLSLVPLARDRPARYYELYQSKTNGHGEDWVSLCSAAGLRDSDGIPDVLESAVYLRDKVLGGDEVDGIHPTHKLHRFDPALLAAHVMPCIKYPANKDETTLLTDTIAKLQDQGDIELHTQDDRVCSKAFRDPMTLKTLTALKVYTWFMLAKLDPEDHVCISAETGRWLCEKPIPELLGKQNTIRVLLAFNIDAEKLKKIYGTTKLEVEVVNPWHHNRHMTIVCEGDRPTRAIYFARHLRTPVITAVYLKSIRDAVQLYKTFEARWKDAQRYNEQDGKSAVTKRARSAGRPSRSRRQPRQTE